MILQRERSFSLLPEVEKERWRKIKRTKGFYLISSFGRVRSTDRYVKHPRSKSGLHFRKGGLRKPTVHKDHGYAVIGFSVDGHDLGMHFVHRLVAEAFIPNPGNKPEVNHKDGNKLNNAVENLEWVTEKENMAHARETGLIVTVNFGSKNGIAKLVEDDIPVLRQLISEGIPDTRVAKFFGVSPETIRRVRIGETWLHA